jgi:hypothetical protein
MGVNEKKLFDLLGHHQFAKFYDTKYCLCVADVEISSSGQKIVNELYTACEQVRRWGCVGVWCRGWLSSALGSVVVRVLVVNGDISFVCVSKDYSLLKENWKSYTEGTKT